MTSLRHTLKRGTAPAAFLLGIVALTATAATSHAQVQPPAQNQTSGQSQQTPPRTASGQSAPVASPPTQPSTVGDVVVTARANDIRSSIDSISYSLRDDLQAQTGTLADALRNVPSVDVDPQGNVSLRGDGNVTILVDGRPSGILSGEGRAQALLQLSADRYARIEVMTNPSAAYSPEGSGGVINLISKPTEPPPGAQTTGSLRANIGNEGRWNIGGSGSWQKDRLTLSGDLSYRFDANIFDFPRLREQFSPLTGALVSSTDIDQELESEQSGTFGRFSADFRLTPRTQLTGELRGAAFEGTTDDTALFETRNASASLTNAYLRDGASEFERTSWGTTARVVHRFDDAGHEWSNELRYDRNINDSSSLADTRFITPVVPALLERVEGTLEQDTLGLTSAYVRPTSDGGKLRLGYELSDQRPDQGIVFLRGANENALVVQPGLSNRFEASQVVHALYATFERPLTDKLSAQAGLRLEQADIEIEDITGGSSASQDYFRAYPTGHINYTLSETQTLRASYSRRIQRPALVQLNPFIAFQDPLNLRSGNPDLEPQETDAFEALWQMRQGQSFYQATAYYRDTDKAFTEVATDVGSGVVLTRPENLGARRDLGLEITANGRLHPTLRYNASINAFRQEIDATGIAGGSDRQATLASGRLSLSWQPTPEDFVQISGFWQGESLLAQGTREAGGMVNFGYRRKLTDSVSFNFTGRDLFNSFSNKTVFETAQFREVSEQNINLRAFFVGLTWSFGSSQRRPPEQFDFSTGPTGG